jgi:hypothetical protein
MFTSSCSHLTARSPAASRALRSLVDFAGLRVMESFFLLAAVGGALIEVAACALIYADYPWLWSWSADRIHGVFSLHPYPPIRLLLLLHFTLRTVVTTVVTLPSC